MNIIIIYRIINELLPVILCYLIKIMMNNTKKIYKMKFNEEDIEDMEDMILVQKFKIVKLKEMKVSILKMKIKLLIEKI